MQMYLKMVHHVCERHFFHWILWYITVCFTHRFTVMFFLHQHFQVKLKTETNMDPTPAISQKKSLLKLLTRTPKKTDISRPLVRVDSVPRQSQECTARSCLCAVCKVYAPGFGRALRASWHQACRVVRFVTLYTTLSSAPVSSFLLLHCANVDCIHHTPVKAGATSRRKRRNLLLIGALS